LGEFRRNDLCSILQRRAFGHLSLIILSDIFVARKCAQRTVAEVKVWPIRI
jgi:hypothetical protein